MKHIKIGEVELNIPENWGEVDLETYIKICKLEQIKNTYTIEDLYIIDLMQIIIGEGFDIDDLTIEELNVLSSEVMVLLQDKTFQSSSIIKIEDQEYKFIEMNKIKVGEYTSIKTLSEGKDVYDTFIDILTILIRPVIDGKIEKYDPEKSELRKELFNKKLMVKDFLEGLNFFLTGNNQYTINMKDISTQEEATI